ncbi:hypothetical protein GCM10007052_31370 [Halioglobus japonicus]|nr:hypothetical protein GCM10007052_31370 [Halioglobus japonicus]
MDYENEYYQESLNKLTPADVYFVGRQHTLDRGKTIELNTLAMRRNMHYDNEMELQALMS